MTPKAKIITALTALALATTALAPTLALARGQNATPPSFEELDMDGNGMVNRADLTAFGAARFAEADTDGNGTLSADELAAHAQARASDRAGGNAQRMLNRMDADGDGALSADEMQARGPQGQRGGDGPGQLLRRADTDGDGAVSEAEYAAALEKMGQRGERGHGREDRPRRHN